MFRILTLTPNVLLLLLLTSFAQAMDDESIFWINSFTVQCEGVAPMTCLQVQESESPEPGKWGNFYSRIEGFTYEAGYLYKLRIRKEMQEDVPADASSIRYVLVDVLEKTRDPKININDIWAVTAIQGEPVDKPRDGQAGPLIEVSLSAMRVTGSDGCNNFIGQIAEFDEGVIEFGPIATTRMMCRDMSVPDKFNSAMLLVRSYRLEPGRLLLLDSDGNELIACRKID
jgi:heat shock protein HslJ